MTNVRLISKLTKLLKKNTNPLEKHRIKNMAYAALMNATCAHSNMQCSGCECEKVCLIFEALREIEED